MKAHPVADMFPMMSDGELRALADDIKTNGLQQPCVLYGAHLLDGRNRWRACEMAGVEIKTKDWSGKDAVAYVRSLNLHRRHLTPAQRAALAVKAEPVYAEAATKGRPKGSKNKVGNRPIKQNEKSRALAQAAKETGASIDSAKAMKQVARAAPEVVELVQRGLLGTVADAKRLARLPDWTGKATVENTRKAFRALARVHHPDLGGDAAKMTEVNVAYSIVMADFERRGSTDGGA